MFNQRKNKSFNYKPRFSNEKKTETNLGNDASELKEFSSKWKQDSHLNKRKLKGGMSIRMLIIVLVLLLICMYILDSKFM